MTTCFANSTSVKAEFAEKLLRLPKPCWKFEILLSKEIRESCFNN